MPNMVIHALYGKFTEVPGWLALQLMKVGVIDSTDTNVSIKKLLDMHSGRYGLA